MACLRVCAFSSLGCSGRLSCGRYCSRGSRSFSSCRFGCSSGLRGGSSFVLDYTFSLFTNAVSPHCAVDWQHLLAVACILARGSDGSHGLLRALSRGFTSARVAVFAAVVEVVKAALLVCTLPHVLRSSRHGARGSYVLSGSVSGGSCSFRCRVLACGSGWVVRGSCWVVGGGCRVLAGSRSWILVIGLILATLVKKQRLQCYIIYTYY